MKFKIKAFKEITLTISEAVPILKICIFKPIIFSFLKQISPTGYALVLAYPETIVSHAKEWYSPFLKYLGIGNKTSVRAGHAAIVLISKENGNYSYFDFGRYITPEPYGRVRSKITDHELNFSFKINIENDKISNLDEFLSFLASKPSLTHGDGDLVASIADINYEKALAKALEFQNKGFIRYAAFIKNACNCSRFVNEVLIHSICDAKKRKKLKLLTYFTPSTVANVVYAANSNQSFLINKENGVSAFHYSIGKWNRKCFLDKLIGYTPSKTGTKLPLDNPKKKEQAQWLSGIAAGAWHELNKTDKENIYSMRRIAPNGRIDTHSDYLINNTGFSIEKPYVFCANSNCYSFSIKQFEMTYRFELINNIN